MMAKIYDLNIDILVWKIQELNLKMQSDVICRTSIIF